MPNESPSVTGDRLPPNEGLRRELLRVRSGRPQPRHLESTRAIKLLSPRCPISCAHRFLISEDEIIRRRRVPASTLQHDSEATGPATVPWTRASGQRFLSFIRLNSYLIQEQNPTDISDVGNPSLGLII
ncbi:hypothetical protein BJX96DRAFT_60219 [Aspergillus floccosus]